MIESGIFRQEAVLARRSRVVDHMRDSPPIFRAWWWIVAITLLLGGLGCVVIAVSLPVKAHAPASMVWNGAGWDMYLRPLEGQSMLLSKVGMKRCGAEPRFADAVEGESLDGYVSAPDASIKFVALLTQDQHGREFPAEVMKCLKG